MGLQLLGCWICPTISVRDHWFPRSLDWLCSIQLSMYSRLLWTFFRNDHSTGFQKIIYTVPDRKWWSLTFQSQSQRVILAQLRCSFRTEVLDLGFLLWCFATCANRVQCLVMGFGMWTFRGLWQTVRTDLYCLTSFETCRHVLHICIVGIQWAVQIL